MEFFETIVNITDQLLKNEYKVDILEHNTKLDRVDLKKVSFISTIHRDKYIDILFSFDYSLAKYILDNTPFMFYEKDDEVEFIDETVKEYLNLVIGKSISNLNSSGLTFTVPKKYVGDIDSNIEKINKIEIIAKQGKMIILILKKREV